jgi:hypothetical protein
VFLCDTVLRRRTTEPTAIASPLFLLKLALVLT